MINIIKENVILLVTIGAGMFFDEALDPFFTYLFNIRFGLIMGADD